MARPVLLVHGWGGSYATTWKAPGWDMLLGDIGRTDVIGVDLLGHGTAPKPREPAAYDDLGARILDALPQEPVDAVGFSLGAMTLLHAATQQPDRFHRVVIAGIGDRLLDPDPTAVNGADAIEAAMRGEGDPANTWAQAMARHGNLPGNDAEALLACLRRPMPFDPVTRESCQRVTAKVLVCIGDKDFAGPSDALAAAIPGATLKVLRNIDHFATPEAFAFIDAVLKFLE
jgi:pimeloyl-ACP methyl ester carboxylesterase